MRLTQRKRDRLGFRLRRPAWYRRGMRILGRILLLIALQLSLLTGWAVAARAPLAGMQPHDWCAEMAAARECAGMRDGLPSGKPAPMAHASACDAACAQACPPLFIETALPRMAVIKPSGVRVAALPSLSAGPIPPPPLRPPAVRT